MWAWIVQLLSSWSMRSNAVDWQVGGAKVEEAFFEGFEIEEVLIELDGPRLFYASTSFCPMLFMLVDEDELHLRHLVVPASQPMLGKLKTGLLTVREAFDQPLLWVVDTNFNYSPQAAWHSELSALPNDVLPEQGVMLWPHRQPMFSLRAIGDGLAEGAVPASVIRQVIDVASTALRKAALFVTNEPTRQGRLRKSLKRLYDLPAQRFAYRSFEIAFGAPVETADKTSSLWENDENELAPLGAALEKVITAATSEDQLESLDITLLEAVEKLVPPLSGVVSEFEVGGRIVNAKGRKYALKREDSQRVKKVLQKVRGREEKISTLEGMVSEMDRDNLTFTLRQTSDDRDHVCAFSSDLFDEVLAAFSQAVRVTVSGRETLKNGNIEVSIFNLNEPAKH